MLIAESYHVNIFFSIVVNVNVCPVILAIQEIAMAAAWNNEINVQRVLNVLKMKNVKRTNETEIWNVDLFAKIFIVVRKQFVYQITILVNANVRVDHLPVIHTI